MSEGLPIKDARGQSDELFVVEYQRTAGRWRPFSIVTNGATWDVEWSRAAGCLLVHDSGSGFRDPYVIHGYATPAPLPGRIWTAPDVTLASYRGKRNALRADTRPLRDSGLARLGYKRLAKLPGNPFEDARHVDGHIEWCAICRDWLDDEPNAPCDHLRWSDDACQPIGSGAEWSECDVYVKESLTALCAELGRERIQRLRRDIAELRCGGDLLHDEHVEAQTAEAWLATIGTGRGDRTRLARSRTLVILDAWLAIPEVAS